MWTLEDGPEMLELTNQFRSLLLILEVSLEKVLLLYHRYISHEDSQMLTSILFLNFLKRVQIGCDRKVTYLEKK